MSGDFKATVKFGDVIGGLTRLSAKGYRAKSTAGKGTRGDVWKKQGRFPRASPVGAQWKHLLPPATSCDNNCVKYGQPGKFTRNSVPKDLYREPFT